MKTSKNIKILAMLCVILLIAFSGCTAKNEQVVKTPGGDVKVSEGSGPDWCKAGTSITTTGPDGKKASFVIKGVTNYEGKEVCESDYIGNGESTIIYTSQDSKYRIMIIKDKSGNETKIDISMPKP
jgi:outer membrane lipoprotein-sorting protein